MKNAGAVLGIGVLAAAGYWFWRVSRGSDAAALLPDWLSPVGPSWQDALQSAPNSYDVNTIVKDYFGDALASLTGVQKYAWKTPAAGQPYDVWFDDAGAKMGLPDGLLSRMAYQETGGSYRSDLVSPKGAKGLMQLMPVHWSQVNPLDPKASIYYAAGLMRSLYRQFGDWSKALAAYNWGPGNLSQRIADVGDGWLQTLPQETYRYVTQIGADVGLIGYGSVQGVA
jgi:soluble lytic murein transglycosylase-like protein